MKSLFYISIFFLSLQIFAQNTYKKASIHKSDSSIEVGLVKIKENHYNPKNSFILFKKNKESEAVNLDSSDISQIDFPDKTYVRRNIAIDEKIYSKYLKVLKKGNLVLLSLDSRLYLENENFGMKDINILNKNLSVEPFYNKAIITKYVNKCNTVHNQVYKDRHISFYDINTYVDTFNKCKEYSVGDNSPSQKAKELSLSYSSSEFLVGIGFGMNTSDYSELQRVVPINYQNNTIVYRLNTSILLYPDNFKKIGFYNFNINYITQGWSNYINSDETIQIKEKIQYVELGTGINFNLFTYKKTTPYIGANGLFLFNFSNYKVIDVAPTFDLYSKELYTNFSYNLKLGAKFQVKKEKFNAYISYYPGYKVTVKSLSSISGIEDNKKQKVTTGSINFNLSYVIF